MVTSPRLPEPKHIWWALIRGTRVDKIRPCIILRVESEFVEVIYGQSEHGERLHSKIAKSAGFSKDTYFLSTNVVLVPTSALTEWIRGACPLRQWTEVLAFSEQAWANHIVDDQRLDPIRRANQSLAPAIPDAAIATVAAEPKE